MRSTSSAPSGIGALPILLRCLALDDLYDGLAPRPLQPCARWALRPSRAVWRPMRTRTNEAFRDRLAGVMSRCGVHDEHVMRA